MTTSPEPGARWLSCHVDYACRHSGACCRSEWPLPVESVVVPVIDDAVVRRRLSTVDGRANWLDDSTARRGEIGGTFRQVNGGCVFHVPTAPMTRRSSGRQRYCAVHAALGHQALPSSCQHFPRVCLIDDRGVRVSLSHYCPTAAAMLADDDAPVAIVDGPAPVAGRAVPEGLDVRDALPPRLTDCVLMDLEGLRAWEEHVVETLAGTKAEATPEHAVARVSADARRLAAWTPTAGPSLACAVAELRASGREGDLRGAAEALADATTWAAWFELAASTCQGAWRADDPPNTLADLDAHYVVPVWPQHAGAVRRYLAAKAFASWIAYQADAAVSLAAWLTLCLAVLRIECARACHAASRPLDRELLIHAIRQSDLLLVHYADSLAIARTLGNRSPEAASG